MQRDARQRLLLWLKSSNVGRISAIPTGGNAERQQRSNGAAPAAGAGEAERTRAREALRSHAAQLSQYSQSRLK